MTSTPAAASLVRKLWQYCNVLRDDGLSYPDYVEQLTYLLFLKMADEQDGNAVVPTGHDWASFAELPAAEMQPAYQRVLAELGTYPGTLGMIFGGARNKISDPAKLRYLVVDLVGKIQWSQLSADVKGDAYEGLLDKNARDTKSGAGQYFTPRPLVEAVVECVDPQPGEVVCDPACGTAGFLLAAREHVLAHVSTTKQSEHLRTRALRGFELVQEVARLAAMNLYLHDVSGDSADSVPIRCQDSLREPPTEHVDVVLSNPPFGIKGSVTYAADSRAADDLTVVRPDFWVRTANKQLNFLQHITALLKPRGRAAVVVPDNVLFEGGAAAAIRRHLLERCDLHTLLRLPPGLFYAHGVLANVLFFDATGERESHGRLWVYDFRTDNRFSLKARPLTRADLDEFVALYRPGDIHNRPDPGGHPRWRAYDQQDLAADPGCRLDLSWEGAADPTSSDTALERLDSIGLQIAEDLQRALVHVARVSARP